MWKMDFVLKSVEIESNTVETNGELRGRCLEHPVLLDAEDDDNGISVVSPSPCIYGRKAYIYIYN
jgi:hypothetical protein